MLNVQKVKIKAYVPFKLYVKPFTPHLRKFSVADHCHCNVFQKSSSPNLKIKKCPIHVFVKFATILMKELRGIKGK